MADTLVLVESAVAAEVRRTLTFHENIGAAARFRLKIGEAELNTTVPGGKTWNVQLTVVITET